MSKRILVVDDDEAIRGYCGLLLKRQGYEVVDAKDVENALEVVSRESFDLIVTDYHIDNSLYDGIEFATILRKRNYHGPIILTSSEVPESVRKDPTIFNITDTLWKLDIEEIVDKAKKCLEAEGSSQEP
ncbi:response regulator [Candidatus Woesearchaeota archaeon]|nr:response regulator [Candidatus Woesearchaeota archaeon]